MVWQWDSDPFGKDAANEQPAGQPTFTYNPRFPGQQFDRESNLHYNYFRDYDPQSGRYVQSDPIGLVGGVNTYAYVDSNPLEIVDIYGLNGTRGGGGAQPRNFGKGKPINSMPTSEDVRKESERVQEHGQNLADWAKCSFGLSACEAEKEIKKATVCLLARCSSNSCPERSFTMDYRTGKQSIIDPDTKCACLWYGWDPKYIGGVPPGLAAPGR
jgi:RHS repeat-associated protein